MLLRRARPEDHAAVAEATLAAYRPHLHPGSAYVERLRDTAARDRDAELWVAVEDERVLGSVTVCPEGSPWRELAAPGEGEFRMLAVAPEAQGRGVGRALVELVLERFRATGTAVVVLSSESSMASAHRLYRRLGFVRTPERDWSPAPGVDLPASRKELDEP